ncbi:hypothetical protein Athai_44270 [Actinocatenispora thailandica]|uniref:Uncharacterized protein n=1 Tax=Actinocatenispora thailandica TaxID=227318 RepID=A0A7R7DSE5_9ACTN|nr:hypothetical protein [Actinocatenispora thailandica]BCJ36924.1 hypothetical protein Athai_44270 [Actinocatenispora thailandica]
MTRGSERRSTALLAPGERWGWEYRLLPAAAPERAAPATPSVPDPDWADAAAERYAAAGRRTLRYRWPTAAAAALAVVGFALAAALANGILALIGSGCAVLAVAGTAGLVLPRRFAARYADAEHQRWLRRCARHAEPVPAPAPEAPAGRWRPLRPAGAEHVDVYGGTDRGWAALLSTVAGSVIGSGGSVTILDLTGSSAARDLVRVAGAAGHRLDLLTLPDHLPSVGLLADLAPAQVGTVLAEAVHAVDRDSDSGDRSGDAGLVGQAVTALRGPVTFRRVGAALRALDGVVADGDALTAAERANLAAALRQVGSQTAATRLRRLAAAAEQLALLEEHDPGVRPYRDPHAQLRVMQLAGDEEDLSTGLLAQVLAGTLLHQVRRLVPQESGPARLLVVAGADGLRRAQLERLDTLARRRGIRLLLLYRRLRGDATAPTGTDATVLMRQPGAAQAAQAARLLPAGIELLVADRTMARAEPTAARRGGPEPEPPGRLPAPPPVPPLPPHPWRPGAEPGVPAAARYAPTPEFLRALPDTAYLLLDPRDGGSPRLLEADPAVLD